MVLVIINRLAYRHDLFLDKTTDHVPHHPPCKDCITLTQTSSRSVSFDVKIRPSITTTTFWDSVMFNPERRSATFPPSGIVTLTPSACTYPGTLFPRVPYSFTMTCIAMLLTHQRRCPVPDRSSERPYYGEAGVLHNRTVATGHLFP